MFNIILPQIHTEKLICFFKWIKFQNNDHAQIFPDLPTDADWNGSAIDDKSGKLDEGKSYGSTRSHHEFEVVKLWAAKVDTDRLINPYLSEGMHRNGEEIPEESRSSEPRHCRPGRWWRQPWDGDRRCRTLGARQRKFATTLSITLLSFPYVSFRLPALSLSATTPFSSSG